MTCSFYLVTRMLIPAQYNLTSFIRDIGKQLIQNILNTGNEFLANTGNCNPPAKSELKQVTEVPVSSRTVASVSTCLRRITVMIISKSLCAHLCFAGFMFICVVSLGQEFVLVYGTVASGLYC